MDAVQTCLGLCLSLLLIVTTYCIIPKVSCQCISSQDEVLPLYYYISIVGRKTFFLFFFSPTVGSEHKLILAVGFKTCKAQFHLIISHTDMKLFVHYLCPFSIFIINSSFLHQTSAVTCMVVSSTAVNPLEGFSPCAQCLVKAECAA